MGEIFFGHGNRRYVLISPSIMQKYVLFWQRDVVSQIFMLSSLQQTKKGGPFVECRRAGLDFWVCPPFLFIMMGFINAIAMITSYFLATRFSDDPAVAISIVVFVSTLIFIVGYFIIAGFNKVAEANFLKTEFINIISHQLRSPLSIFKWTLDILSKEIKDRTFHEEDDTYLNIMKENTERMVQLVNLLLEATRIESNRMVLKRVVISLHATTEDIVRSVVWYAKAYNVDIEFHAMESPPDVIGDPDRMKMVVQNLIDNAIRYSRGGGRVDIARRRDGNFLRWEIKDRSEERRVGKECR